MKRMLLIIVIAMFIVLSVSGCSSQSTEQVSEPASGESIEQNETAPEQETVIEENSYFVSVNGSDANEGTMDAPWRTFEKAVSVVEPGYTVYVMEGTYIERLIIDKSGAEDAFITFMAYPGHEVTIDGYGMQFESWGGLIKIDRQNYIRVSGFNVINSPAMGIFACDSRRITIDNNYVYNTFAPGIHCWGDTNLIIDNNTLEWTCNEENAPLECISLRRTENFQISNNHVFNSGAIGIDSAESFSNGKIYNNEVHDTGVGIYLDGWEQYGVNVEVYDNLCYNNHTGFAVNAENGGTVEHIKLYNNVTYGNEADGFNICWGGILETDHIVKNLEIYNNLSYGNGTSGFSIFGIHRGHVENVIFFNNISHSNTGIGIHINGIAKEPLKYTFKNITIVNNTIYNNGTQGVWSSGGIFVSNPDTSTGHMENIIIKNNIVSQNEMFSIAVWKHGMQPDGVIIKANLIDGYLNDAHGYGETKGYDYVLGDPKFADAANGDFHIMEGSPAIDAGTADNAPEEDFDGIIRPQGTGIDIGAYEFK